MFDDMWMHANQEFVHCMFMWRNFKLWRFVSLKLRKSNMSPRLTGSLNLKSSLFIICYPKESLSDKQTFHEYLKQRNIWLPLWWKEMTNTMEAVCVA